jgi:hypothetical protein
VNNVAEAAADGISRLRDILADGVRDFYRAQGCIRGQIDLFLLDRQAPIAQILAVLEGLLGFVDATSRKTLFRQVWVVVPASEFNGDVLNASTARLTGLVDRARKAYPDHQLPADWLHIRTTGDYQQTTLEQVVAAAPQDAALILTALADYRCPGIAPNDPGPLRLKLDEDIWVPHVTHLAKSLEGTAKAGHLYIAGLVSRLPPRRAALRDALQTIEGGIQVAERPVDLETEILTHEDDIAAHLAAGHIGAAMAIIDAMPSVLNGQKPFLKIQFLDRAKLPQAALDMIEKDLAPDAETIDPVSLIRLAIIAERAGGAALAARLIRLAIPQLTQRESLEATLELAEGLPQYDLIVSARERLQQLFPDSVLLLQHQAEQAREAGDYKRAAELAASLPGKSQAAALYRSFYALTRDPGFDHDQVLAQLVAEQPQWKWRGHRLLVEEALRGGRLFHAFRWALGADASLFRPHLLMETLERLVLERTPQGHSVLSDDDLILAISRILRHMATNPDAGLRVRLVALLSPEMLGLHGVSLIIIQTNKAVLRPKRIARTPLPKGLSEAEWDQLNAFMRQAIGWLGQQNNLILGRACLPAEMLTLPADRLCRGIGELITEQKFDTGDADDAKALTTFATVGAAAAAHAVRPTWDIELIRLAGARLGTGGQGQMARDLAETAFEIAGDNPVRQRAAWLAMADIYQRVGNRLEGFVTLAAGALSDSEREIEDAWEELQILMRLCRDQGLFDQALQIVDAMEQVGTAFGVIEANRNRLELMRLQIAQQKFGEDDADCDALAAFLRRFAAHAQAALDREGDLLPVAMSFGQLLMRTEALHVPVPQEVRQSFDLVIAELPKEAANFVRIMSSTSPSKDDLFALAGRMQPARYADDAGTDARHGAMLARRCLSSPASRNDPAAVALATECLADRATPVPGWEAIGRPPVPIATANGALEQAQSLSAGDAAVLLFGLDDAGALVRLLVRGGNAEPAVVESEAVFSRDALRDWRQEFPFRYGVDQDTPNLFYTSTEGLGLSLQPGQPLILAGDVSLQVIPPNLWRIGESFLGLMQPCASVPSLSWLAEARTKTALSRRRLAWISGAEEKGRTLSMVAERLHESFEAHHIVLDRSESLPKGFDGAELAIVTAHGGLLPDGSFFQVVRDEGRVVVDAADFAGAFHNVGLMVLFVCSGGRQDRHPDAVATVGLVKRILKAGCATVIASPWPMDSRIPSHWLPAFLDHWTAGATAMAANFAANQAVGQVLGGALSEALALNVFGDPLRKGLLDSAS